MDLDSWRSKWSYECDLSTSQIWAESDWKRRKLSFVYWGTNVPKFWTISRIFSSPSPIKVSKVSANLATLFKPGDVFQKLFNQSFDIGAHFWMMSIHSKFDNDENHFVWKRLRKSKCFRLPGNIPNINYCMNSSRTTCHFLRKPDPKLLFGFEV